MNLYFYTLLPNRVQDLLPMLEVCLFNCASAMTFPGLLDLFTLRVLTLFVEVLVYRRAGCWQIVTAG